MMTHSISTDTMLARILRFISALAALLMGLTFFVGSANAEDEDNEPTINFTEDVQPILEHNCVACHWEKKSKAKLRMDTKEHAFKYEDLITPGKPDDSSIYWTTTLPEDDDLFMPPLDEPGAYPLTKAEKAVLKTWIEEGADWPDGVTLTPKKRLPATVDFVEHIQPILEINCVACHWENKKKGGVRLDTLELALDGDGVLTPGDAKNSSIWWTTILPDDDDLLMPPPDDHERLSPRDSALLRRWIEDGAAWPEDISLKPQKTAFSKKGIHPIPLYEELGFKPGPVMAPTDMKPYDVSIDHTDVGFSMAPIPGGTFTMGSPDDEDGREDDEMSPLKVSVSPFWMGTCEVTWDEYNLWMESIELDLRVHKEIAADEDDVLPDAVTRPTPLYRPDLVHQWGKDGNPAICMTQLAARMYTMWLSARTGDYYRLPTAAEWEFAARGGANDGPYGKGITEDTLGDFAWYEDNSDEAVHPIGKLKPNAFGLHDIYGNVWEWVLDDYDLADWKPGAFNPLRIPDEEYNRTVRGGGYKDYAEDVRAAARLASEEMWKMQDPQFPQSVWHHTDALHVGFRVVRPLDVPTQEDISKFWPSAEEIEDIPER